MREASDKKPSEDDLRTVLRMNLIAPTWLYEEKYAAVFAHGHRFGPLPRVELKDLQLEPYPDHLHCEPRARMQLAETQ